MITIESSSLCSRVLNGRKDYIIKCGCRGAMLPENPQTGWMSSVTPFQGLEIESRHAQYKGPESHHLPQALSGQKALLLREVRPSLEGSYGRHGSHSSLFCYGSAPCQLRKHPEESSPSLPSSVTFCAVWFLIYQLNHC